MTVKLPLARALNAGLARALEQDRRALVLGEDVGPLGGVFRVTEGLQDRFGDRRVFDTPLAESAIIGASIGLAFRGYRPVAEIQFDGFIFPGFNQITTQLAKMRNRTRGDVDMSVVVRVPVGGGIGAVEHHSESPESLFVHTAGLRVVCPATPSDAYWMIQQAIASNDPILFMEPKRRYWVKGEVDTDAAEAPLPLHRAHVARPGTDVTLVAWGALVQTSLEAAEAASEEGTSIEVVDLRSLSPIDFDTIEESVARTGRLVVAHEAPVFGGLGGEIAARITERCFYSLEAPVLRVGGYSTPYPPARLEHEYLPDLDRVLDGVDRALAH